MWRPVLVTKFLNPAALFALVLVFSSSAAGAQEKVRMLLDWTPVGQHAAAHLAVTKGYFRAAGLDVDIVDGKGGLLTVQSIASGQADIGQALLGTAAVARNHGLPVISIAGFMRQIDGGLLFPKDDGIKTLKDLVGRKIAYSATSGVGPFFDTFLKLGGLSRDQVKTVNVDASALIGLYASGNADAVFLTITSQQYIINQRRPSSALTMDSVGLDIPGTGLVVKTATLDSRSAMLAKFVPAIMKAWSYIIDGHADEGVDAILAQRSNDKLDRAALKSQVELTIPFFYTAATKDKPLGWQDKGEWAQAIRVMESVDALKPGSKPEDYFTNRFIQN